MKHETIEKNIGLMMIFITLVISVGAAVEIVPLFFAKETTQPIEGLKPHTAMQLEGRDIYIREGCHVCHTQMIRPLRAETERYGHYSVAGEYVYENPFLWGSKRTGPDLARVGGRYSDDWHKLHLYNPRDVVPGSNMPAFPWLWEQTIDGNITGRKMAGLCVPLVCHTPMKISLAPKQKLTGQLEIEALVQYLQQLGTVIKHKR